MHKSIIVLLGLLVFLIPVAPSMSNSNAMAVEDYGYEETDQYENYATDMANENNYKSQDSDLIKKIKCNNINSNFNGVEANIGTGDSLGLGAESILGDDASANWLGNGGERNGNGNFDLDCINNNNNENNNEGGQGSPVTLQLIEGTNVYRVTDSDELELNPLSVSAECEPGDFVLNGGYGLNAVDPAVTTTIADQPITTPEGGGWRTEVSGNDGLILTVEAYCFDNSP